MVSLLLGFFSKGIFGIATYLNNVIKTGILKHIDTALYMTGLSESFEVDRWVVKVSGESSDISFKNAIRKEMLSRVAGRH